jgi:hypothetical protein
MYPTKSLQPGQRGADVSQLQQFLLEQGFLTAAQIATGPGIYGPQTKAAVEKWQVSNGVDNTSGPGYWGPRSIAVASGGQSSTGGNAEGETQESVDASYKEAASKNPAIVNLASGGSSLEDIVGALETGDFSNIVDSAGQPFSAEDQQAALTQAMEDNKLFYEAQQAKETADAESDLAKQQADYQNYLINSAQGFEADKTKLDKDAADAGVLFSGSRAQKERSLERAYAQDQAYKQAAVGRNIASTANDFQYRYGAPAMSSLSSYYNLGGNTFNANVASGGVGSSSLSSAYNPSGYNFQGTVNTERSAEAKKRAAGYLWNKGNKLLSTGYTNQY